MKIAVIGYSGSGKSTLARKLGEQGGLPVLHLDSVWFLPGWQERPREDMRAIVTEYLDTHESWVIDGNYFRICFERRMEEADRIVLMQFSPLACLLRVYRRYRMHRGHTRPDMGEGCPEKVDREFACWVLWKGRSRENRALLRSVRREYPEKVVHIRNQRQLDAYERECGLCLK